jgi:hypothetical protein
MFGEPAGEVQDHDRDRDHIKQPEQNVTHPSAPLRLGAQLARSPVRRGPHHSRTHHNQIHAAWWELVLVCAGLETTTRGPYAHTHYRLRTT